MELTLEQLKVIEEALNLFIDTRDPATVMKLVHQTAMDVEYEIDRRLREIKINAPTALRALESAAQ